MRKKQNLRVSGAIALLIGAAVGWQGAAQAGGFQVSELSVRGQGNRNAGAAAAADSAATAYFNPAGLAKLEQRAVEVGAHLILPQFEFHDSGSSNAVGGAAQGDEVNDGGGAVPVANTFLAVPIDERTTFGLSVVSPYGLVTEYDDRWIGRYHAIRSDLMTIDFNPGIGYEVSDRLSLGLGLSAQYASAELTHALDFGTAGFLAGVPGMTPSTPAFDGRARVEGDGWAFGFNAGLLFDLTDQTRLGVGYRSAVNHDLEGENKVDIPALAAAALGRASFDRDASVEVTMPQIVYLDFQHRIDDKLTLLGGVSWTDWSTFDELRIEFDMGEDSVQPENWEDAWRYTLGLKYAYSPTFTLRTGVQFDESPIPDEYRTPRVPGADEWWFAIGGSWKPEPKSSFTVDFAYSYVWLDDYTIADTEVTTADLTGAPVGSTLAGTYDSSAHVLSLQLQWDF